MLSILYNRTLINKNNIYSQTLDVIYILDQSHFLRILPADSLNRKFFLIKNFYMILQLKNFRFVKYLINHEL